MHVFTWKKPSRLPLYRTLFLASTLIGMLPEAKAQTPNDGIMMGKHMICNVASYTKSEWSNYWEGTRLRHNDNVGTFTNQNVMLMSAYGLTKNLNIIAGLPYVWTKSTNGHFAGQRGIQDFSVWLKYRPIKAETSFGTFGVLATGGLSIPATKYIPDMLPYCIGIGAKTATLKGILNYNIKGIYVTGHVGYIMRGKINIDRDSYQYNGSVYDTHQVAVPDVVDASVRLGYLNKHVQVEAFVDNVTSQSGDDIRRQDMPFPTNKMDQTAVGGMAKVHLYLKNGSFFTLLGQYSEVKSGRNVGQARIFTVGIQHTFNVLGK